MPEDRIEVMKIILEEGSDLIDTMNDRVDLLKSKNMDFMTTILSIVSLIAVALFFAVEQKWLPVAHLVISLLFFAPVLWSLHLCYTLFRPRPYPVLTTYDEPNLGIALNATPEDVLSHLIYRKRETLQAIEKRYSAELPVHKQSIGWFAGALMMLVLFLAIEFLTI